MELIQVALLSAALVTHPIQPAAQTFISTAYCLQGTTTHGESAGPGIVAVDPEVIPLGSKVRIEGIGEFLALDTGEDIKGKRIDIWMPTYEECINFGRQPVEVTIIFNASRGGSALGRKLDGENEAVRNGDWEDSDPAGARSVGYNQTGSDDRSSIFQGPFRPRSDKVAIRQSPETPKGHQDGGIPINREERWNPKGKGSAVNSVRKETKDQQFRDDRRASAEHSRRALLLYGQRNRHFAREARSVSSGLGECETGSELNEVGE